MKRTGLTIAVLAICALALYSFKSRENAKGQAAAGIPVIFDTDANNELDDQHALAYLLLNSKTFDVKGVTVNATSNGGNIDEQYAEAERILKLSKADGKIPLLKGANGNFDEIEADAANASFDGSEAVNFIIAEASKKRNDKLVLLAVGKLTNVALALKKDPSIADKIRVVWLGSNYPEPGEYNQDNDIPSVNYTLSTTVPFEMVTVRYGKPSGTSAVTVTQKEIKKMMPGKGPKVSEAVIGRHGNSFQTFGDYSVELFEKYGEHGKTRALYDMAAVAIVKNPEWAKASSVPAPVLKDNKWVEQPKNKRKMIVWENFDRDRIMADFYASMDNYTLVKAK